ncbi:hypothetical protein Peur_009608 [Populus x canadensis]
MHGSATGTYEDPSKKKQGRSVFVEVNDSMTSFDAGSSKEGLASSRVLGSEEDMNTSSVSWEAIASRQVLSLYQGLETKNLQSFISHVAMARASASMDCNGLLIVLRQ